MGHEKKHKEEVVRATQLWECGDITRENLEYIFPELKESEDEKIRKALIRYHQSTINIDGIKGEEILAWLERQVEKPKWSKEDEEELEIAIETLHEAGQHSSAIWLKSLKPRMEE